MDLCQYKHGSDHGLIVFGNLEGERSGRWACLGWRVERTRAFDVKQGCLDLEFTYPFAKMINQRLAIATRPSICMKQCDLSQK